MKRITLLLGLLALTLSALPQPPKHDRILQHHESVILPLDTGYLWMPSQDPVQALRWRDPRPGEQPLALGRVEPNMISVQHRMVLPADSVKRVGVGLDATGDTVAWRIEIASHERNNIATIAMIPFAVQGVGTLSTGASLSAVLAPGAASVGTVVVVYVVTDQVITWLGEPGFVKQLQRFSQAVIRDKIFAGVASGTIVLASAEEAARTLSDYELGTALEGFDDIEHMRRQDNAPKPPKSNLSQIAWQLLTAGSAWSVRDQIIGSLARWEAYFSQLTTPRDAEGLAYLRELAKRLALYPDAVLTLNQRKAYSKAIGEAKKTAQTVLNHEAVTILSRWEQYAFVPSGEELMVLHRVLGSSYNMYRDPWRLLDRVVTESPGKRIPRGQLALYNNTLPQKLQNPSLLTKLDESAIQFLIGVLQSRQAEVLGVANSAAVLSLPEYPDQVLKVFHRKPDQSVADKEPDLEMVYQDSAGRILHRVSQAHDWSFDVAAPEVQAVATIGSITALVMERVPNGYSFADLIALGQSNWPEWLHGITKDEVREALTTAVEALHTGGIQHNDLHLGNLMWGYRDGRPILYIIDYGRATAPREKSRNKELATIGRLLNTLFSR